MLAQPGNCTVKPVCDASHSARDVKLWNENESGVHGHQIIIPFPLIGSICDASQGLSEFESYECMAKARVNVRTNFQAMFLVVDEHVSCVMCVSTE
jgi:hypothetical protein